MLTAEAQDVDLSVGAKGGGFLNFLLMILIVGAAGAGIWQLSIVSSTRHSKRSVKNAKRLRKHTWKKCSKKKIRRIT